MTTIAKTTLTKAFRATVGACAVAATALVSMPLTATPAHAVDTLLPEHVRPQVHHCGRHGKRCGVRHHKPRHYYGKRHKHYRGKHSNGDAAAIILGLTGLAIVGGALANQNRTLPRHADPNYRHHQRGYYPPAPRRGGDHVITYSGSLEPWSPGWFDWCDKRYRSFNRQTGTFRGYDGRDHFCVPR